MLNVIPSKFKHSFNAAVIWEGFKVEDVRSLANFYFSTRLMSHKAKGSSRLKRYLESENFFHLWSNFYTCDDRKTYMSSSPWQTPGLVMFAFLALSEKRAWKALLSGDAYSSEYLRTKALPQPNSTGVFFLTNTNKPATLGQRSQLQIHRKRPANGSCMILKSLYHQKLKNISS